MAVAPRCSLEARKGLKFVLAPDHRFDRTRYIQAVVASLEKLAVGLQRDLVVGGRSLDKSKMRGRISTTKLNGLLSMEQTWKALRDQQFEPPSTDVRGPSGS